MRVSDIERQRTVDELRRHCAAGRIDIDEYGRRVEVAMSAATLFELDAVLADLPMLRIADPSAQAGERSAPFSRAGRLFAPREIGRGSGEGAEGDGAARRARRIASSAAALVIVGVVVAAVLLVALVSWTWAALLVAGWVAGLVQSAVSRRR